MPNYKREVYLKPNVVIEPLIDKWYAWSHLISPCTAAMNIVERHIKIMESFILAPNVHEQAVKNPKMLGGPFMDLPPDRTGIVNDLLKTTLESRKSLIELANGIRELNRLLLGEASGFGLENLYERIPSLLRGYVELFYDLNGNPGFRFFEALLYESAFYDESTQSIALWLTNNDRRPFCLSTPRLADSQAIDIPIPFNRDSIDSLARMKRKAKDFETIKQELNIPPEAQELFATFFTEEAPGAYLPYNGNKIRMRYFGHACILIETDGISILIDPLISYYGYHSTVEHFSDYHLPEEIDYVLITHNHQDHILLETLLPLRHRIKKMIVPASHTGKLEDPDLKRMFKKIGFQNVTAIEEMDVIKFDDLTITGIPFTGEHSDLNILSKSCYLVSINSFKLLFFADSRIVEPELYHNIQKITGDVDVIFLGMECDGAPLSWLYGPLMPSRLSRDKDSSRRLSGSDCSRGLALVDIFHPKEAYVYAMGQEPWVEFISSIKYTDDSNPIIQSDMFISKCKEMGIKAERLFGEKEILYAKS
ncbi:MBL fold metallo-hydrolase [Mucilaginibacter sp. RCC_168]|uniref:MBL fold metallo-hydrolase n=1 Tax=Mucilaginibacter sp. RCC_168 TaxID=3239221 RepID=UPI00352515AC